ncbi:MAG: ABC transporter substrate-binding protein [Spirochaetaceae bacterium]|nr:ABC transporter substrate-binding protein [Spirochaetaceae bacterium]
MKKRIWSVCAVLCVALAAMGCAKKSGAAAEAGIIGISKIVAHEALDAVEKGVVDKINESGRNLRLNQQNAAGDVNAASQIATVFKNEKVLVAVGIATPTALALANSITDIPVVFSAVTDPVGARLVDSLDRGRGNVTGVSDAIDEPTHVRMFKEIAGIKTLGYIYTSSEDNSISSLAKVRNAAQAEGLVLVEQAITNSSELRQAAQAIIGRVDGVYITNDNTIYAAFPTLIEVCSAAKKPLFSADVTACRGGGALVAFGFDYYKIGLATGEIVLQILDGKAPADIPTRFLTEKGDTELLIDLDVAAACGITVPQSYLDQANLIFENGSLRQK